MISVNADICRYMKRFFRNIPGRQVRILQQCACRRQGIIAARADCQHTVIGFDDFPIAGNEQDALAVCDEEQGFQLVQDFVRPPVFGQLDSTAYQIAIVFIQFIFKTIEQGERIGYRSGKTTDDFAMVQAADLLGRSFLS